MTDYEVAKANKEHLSAADRKYLEYLEHLENTDPDYGYTVSTCECLWDHYSKSGCRHDQIQ